MKPVWSELPVDFSIDKTGKSVDFRAAWATLSYEDKDARISLRDGTLSGTQRRGAGNIWYGPVQGGIEYDAAVLAAFACCFIPALQDGKPVARTLTHTLSREPGSARP